MNVDTVPILATIILIATAATFILGIGAYVIHGRKTKLPFTHYEKDILEKKIQNILYTGNNKYRTEELIKLIGEEVRKAKK